MQQTAPSGLRRRRALLSLLALGLSATVLATSSGCSSSGAKVVPAPTSALPARSPGDELYDLSPARVHIRRLQPQALRLLAPHWSRVRESDRKPLQATLVSTLSEERVVPFMRARLAKAVAERPDLAAKTLEWLKSPIGYEVKFAEATAWTGDKNPEDTFYANVAAVRDNRMPEIRAEPVKKLVEATGALDRTLDLTAAVGTVVARLVNVAQPDKDPLPLEALGMAVGRERRVPAVVAAYAPVVTASLLLRTRDLDLDALEQYIAFASTEAGRWYHDTMSAALVDAVAQASMDVEGVFHANAHSDDAAPTSSAGFDLDALQVPLPSGRSVRLLALAQTGPANQPAVVLRYETSLPLHDSAAVSGEAREVWDKLKGQIEQEGAQAAVLQATGLVDGWVFPFASSRKYAWRRDEGGQWIAMTSKPGLGTVEREMLWSVPP